MPLIDKLTRDSVEWMIDFDDDGLDNFYTGMSQHGDGMGPLVPDNDSDASGPYPAPHYYITQSEAVQSGFKFGYIQLPDDESNGFGGENRPGVWEESFPFDGLKLFGSSGYGYFSQTCRTDYNLQDSAVTLQVGKVTQHPTETTELIRLWGRVNNPHQSSLTAYMVEIACNASDATNQIWKLYRVDNHNTFVQLGSTYNGPVNLNDNLTLEIIGSALEVAQNGTSRITATDSTYSSAGLWGFGCGQRQPFTGWGLKNLQIAIAYTETATLNPITSFGGHEADFYSRSTMSDSAEGIEAADSVTINVKNTLSIIDHYCAFIPLFDYDVAVDITIDEGGIALSADCDLDIQWALNTSPDSNPC